MRLALRKPRLFLCSTCHIATRRFVDAWHSWKELEEQVFQMRAKFISAIKLSADMASSSSEDSPDQCPSRKMRAVIEAVKFLRTCFINGECPSPAEVEKEPKRRRRPPALLTWDAEKVLADLIADGEGIENPSVPSLSVMTAESTCDDADPLTLMKSDDVLPDLDIYTAEVHFTEGEDFTTDEQSQNDQVLSVADTDLDYQPNPLGEKPPSDSAKQILTVPSSCISNLEKDASESLAVNMEQISRLKSKRRSGSKSATRGKYKRKRNDKTTSSDAANSGDPQFLVGREIVNFKRRETWAKIKSKYPSLTQERYRALRQKKSEALQKCSNDGVPSRASVGRQSWLSVPVKQVPGEDGKVRYFFKDVEIKKMEDGLLYCGICGESRKYREMSYAKTHINKNHIDLSNGFGCEYCGRKFYYHNLLTTHLHIAHHVGGKSNFQCEVCGEVFGNQATRYAHKRVVHDGIKPHTCEYCGKSFGRKKDMTVHVRRHTGEKPFVCHVCAYAFVDKQTMKAHIMRRHPEAANDLPPPANPSTKGRIRKPRPNGHNADEDSVQS